MLCHPYDTPTIITNVFCLVNNEWWLKHPFLLYKRGGGLRGVARGL